MSKYLHPSYIIYGVSLGTLSPNRFRGFGPNLSFVFLSLTVTAVVAKMGTFDCTSLTHHILNTNLNISEFVFNKNK